MPDRFSQFCKQVHKLVIPYGASRLSRKTLDDFNFERFAAGWSFDSELVYQGEQIQLYLLLPPGAPYERVAVAARTSKALEPLSFPHVESNGKLCVWSDRVLVDPEDPGYIIDFLREAKEQLAKNLAGELTQDFEDEFLSYWYYHASPTYSVTNLCDHRQRSTRQVFVRHLKGYGYIFADSSDELLTWLQKRNEVAKVPAKKVRHQSSRIQPAALFYLEKPWQPNEFPKTAGALLRLIDEYYDELSDQFVQLLADTLCNPTLIQPCILIAFNTPYGTCFSAVVFHRGLYTRDSRNKYKGSGLTDGFRKAIPKKVLLQRLETLPLFGANVTRSDYHWIIGRENNPASEILPRAGSVLIIGCGSVGSVIARLLIQSGVTEITLVDGESLAPENITRHASGYSGVGKNKASYNALSLEKEYPFANIHAIPFHWQEALKSGNEATHRSILEADLIISCTADWFSDQGLLALQSDRALNPIIFAFTEAHAMAGHVIVHPKGSGAFQALHHMRGEKVGAMLRPVTAWSSDTQIRLPACGGAFQPYGVIDLTHLHALAAETALELLTDKIGISPLWKVWIARRSKLVAEGGTWNPDWISHFGDPQQGGITLVKGLQNQEWVDTDG